MNLRINSIRLINFRNYEDSRFSFVKDRVAVVGPNGSGKTNLLDAIHYLSQTKGFNNYVDTQNIRHGQEFFTIKADVEHRQYAHTLQCSVQEGAKKRILLDQNEYERVADHIGWMPVVVITPDDVSLINEGSEGRRKWLDMVISHSDREYLDQLIRYNSALKQRNALLKQFLEQKRSYADQLDPYDHQLVTLGKRIAERRNEVCGEIVPLIKDNYAYISDGSEIPQIRYDSECIRDNFEERFAENRRRDLITGRTNCGTHRDDLFLLLDGHRAKKYASQGQKKSLLIALKMAQLSYFREHTGLDPLLLLDDIFDKLDDQRIEKLLLRVRENHNGQLFITDARPERTLAFFEQADVDVQKIQLNEEKG